MIRILTATALIAAAIGPGCAPDDRPARRPNVLIVVLDTTRADILSSYGCEAPTTPSIDAVAAEDFAILRELYSAEVNVADELVGQVIAELESTGLLDETLVIITSDHGENLGDHDLTGHMLSMHESTLRVPLIVRYPPRFAAGLVRDELVSLIDVVPTVLDVTGLATDENRTYLERHSLAGAIREAREFVIAENDRPLTTVEVLRTNFPDFDAASVDHRMRVIREERYKLIWRIGVGVERDPRTPALAGLP